MTATERSDTGLTVSATRGDGIYSSFEVSVSPSLGSDNQPGKTYPVGKFEVSLSGLTPGTVYTITMWAISGNERSADFVKSFNTSKFVFLLKKIIIAFITTENIFLMKCEEQSHQPFALLLCRALIKMAH